MKIRTECPDVLCAHNFDVEIDEGYEYFSDLDMESHTTECPKCKKEFEIETFARVEETESDDDED